MVAPTAGIERTLDLSPPLTWSNTDVPDASARSVVTLRRLAWMAINRLRTRIAARLGEKIFGTEVCVPGKHEERSPHRACQCSLLRGHDEPKLSQGTLRAFETLAGGQVPPLQRLVQILRDTVAPHIHQA